MLTVLALCKRGVNAPRVFVCVHQMQEMATIPFYCVCTPCVQEMFTFPVLQHVFCAMADQGGYAISCNRPVKSVTRRNGGVDVEDEQGVQVRYLVVHVCCSVMNVC